MRRNTQEQNRNLDVVGGAAADIKRLAYVGTFCLSSQTTSLSSDQLQSKTATLDVVGGAAADIKRLAYVSTLRRCQKGLAMAP